MATREWTYSVKVRVEVDELDRDCGPSVEEDLEDAQCEVEQMLCDLAERLANEDDMLALPDLSLCENVALHWELAGWEGWRPRPAAGAVVDWDFVHPETGYHADDWGVVVDADEDSDGDPIGPDEVAVAVENGQGVWGFPPSVLRPRGGVRGR